MMQDDPDSDDIQYLDLGAIQIPLLGNPEIRMNIDQESMKIVGFSILLENSIAEFQVFACARNEQLWPSVSKDLLDALNDQGVSADVVSGEFGAEVRAVMPLEDVDGNNVIQPVRFVGIDGDRWFLRAAISGAAAVNESDIELVDEILANVQIDRGNHAMAHGELFTIDMPDFGQPD